MIETRGVLETYLPYPHTSDINFKGKMAVRLSTATLFPKSMIFFLLTIFMALQNAQITQSQDTAIVSISGPSPALYHDISYYAKDNVEICKSRPFAPTQLNYIRSGADSWLKNYTLENKDRAYFKKHGLVSTIAFDFLGDTNFKCAIGVQHSCTVQCPNIVGQIEDLALARRVYFVLSSTGHFVSAVDMVHVCQPFPDVIKCDFD